MEKLIITVAIIGNATDRSQNPHVPITPKEIAESAIESAKVGAAVCHIHVRDPETGQVSMDFEFTGKWLSGSVTTRISSSTSPREQVHD